MPRCLVRLRLIQSWSNSNGEWPGYSVANWLTPVAQDPEVVADPQTVLQHTRNIEHARYTAGGDAFRPAADVLGLLGAPARPLASMRCLALQLPITMRSVPVTPLCALPWSGEESQRMLGNPVTRVR